MPRGDGTGPMGMGSMTGRQAGFCAGNQSPGFANPMWGRGFGGGRGRGGRGGGFGHRHWHYATGLTGWQRAGMGWPMGGNVTGRAPGVVRTEEQEVEALEKQAAIVERSLEEIHRRIQEIKSTSDEEQ